MSELVTLTRDGDIGVITINNPPVNALSPGVPEGIEAALREYCADSSVKAIILIGGGRTFIAGADIKELGKLASGAKGIDTGMRSMFPSLEDCSKPVIAAVNGFALGGGCELAMSCHLRVASSNAKFGQPEVKLGVIPGYAGTQRLVQLIGKAKALELLMTADMIGAEEALQYRLVNYVTTPEHLMDKCRELMNKIMAQSPQAIRSVIRCVNAFYKDGVDGFQFEIDEFGRCFGTQDFKEGVKAFMEKRKPDFAVAEKN